MNVRNVTLNECHKFKNNFEKMSLDLAIISFRKYIYSFLNIFLSIIVLNKIKQIQSKS